MKFKHLLIVSKARGEISLAFKENF